jgi:hypothetical protein
VTDYAGLLEVIRRRMRELNITFETLDVVSGVQLGYSSKILGPTPSKCFGPVSLGCVLGALGMKLVAVEDPEQLAKVRDRLTPRSLALPVRSEMGGIAPEMAADSLSGGGCLSAVLMPTGTGELLFE